MRIVVSTARSLRPAAALLLACLLGACATDRDFGGDPQLTMTDMTALPEPLTSDIPGGVEPYLIGPYDELTISVFGIDELSERPVRADSSGTLAFPLAGTIHAAGMSPQEVAAIISERLRDNHVRDPQVTVNLKETVTRTFTVDGQVTKPGSYPALGRISLIRAIAIAGSTEEFARLKDVVVFREVGGRRYAALYNLEAIREGRYPDPRIYPDDVIVVGDSSARRLFRDVLQIVPLLTTPLIVFFQNR